MLGGRFAILGALLLTALQSGAVELRLEPPTSGSFMSDPAHAIDVATGADINRRCSALLRDLATPIIVVSIDSMAAHGGENLSIEGFATQLFNQWQIGHAAINGQNWNKGILLVVSKGDRKARIELGAGWGRDEDPVCQTIMDEYIVPMCRAGQYSAAMLAGVEALDHMARKLTLPHPPKPWWFDALMIGAIGLGIFTVISLLMQGPRGWAALLWIMLFSLVGSALYGLVTSIGKGGDSGGFGGGSFGGGFSGGGGATGSW